MSAIRVPRTRRENTVQQRDATLPGGDLDQNVLAGYAAVALALILDPSGGLFSDAARPCQRPAAVRGLLRDSGVKPLRLPASSPNLNAYAERFVLSIRRECLDRFVPLSERHLRTAVTEYVVHYHTERNHQGLGNELITSLPASAKDAGPIVSRERLGGMLNYYCRAA